MIVNSKIDIACLVSSSSDGVQRRCLRLLPNERPTFTELRKELDHFIFEDQRQSYLKLDEPYVRFNRLNEDLLNLLTTDKIVGENDSVE